jgi:hypothetical protein
MFKPNKDLGKQHFANVRSPLLLATAFVTAAAV